MWLIQTNGVNGEVDWNEGDSFLREKFNPKFLNTTTEDRSIIFL